MPSLRELSVSDDPAAWRAAGFTVDDDGQCVIGGVRLFLRPQEGRTGIIAWALGDAGELAEVDGIPTTAPTLDPPAEPVEHANGATGIDHLVVASPDVERTKAAFEAIGMAARRTRETESYGAPMQQIFFRAGEVIVELVGSPNERGEGPVRFFGVAIDVRDLGATKALLGAHLGDAKDAVQPGRQIATLRGKELGITTAIALMTEAGASA